MHTHAILSLSTFTENHRADECESRWTGFVYKDRYKSTTSRGHLVLGELVVALVQRGEAAALGLQLRLQLQRAHLALDLEAARGRQRQRRRVQRLCGRAR